MKLAYFDCPSGAAGDMILGALVDAGLPFDALREALGRLPIGGYALERREVMKGAFRATKVEVHVEGRRRGGSHESHSHAAAPSAGARSTGRPDAGRDHEHRTLPTILGILAESGLPEPVTSAATRIFTRLAEAEGRVHAEPPDQVRFHDVGAVDAIVDIAGACIGLHLLGVEAVHVSALPVGGGMVRGPHGPMPVPAPGTAELLKGFPVVDTGVKRELVTPTGAAILTTLAASAGRMPAMSISAVGYGAGTLDLETPNVVRLFLGEAAGADQEQTIAQVETTVDDMSPQLYEPLMEQLFAAGALDVYLTQVVMKKSRPGIVVTALCEPDAVPALTRACFSESTTIGVRWTTYRRRRLPREIVELDTSLGRIPFKLSRLDGRVVTVTPEFDDVKRAARERGLPVREALDLARAEGRRLLGQ